MTPLFKKMNFKDQAEILVLNAPDSFEGELSVLGDAVRIHRKATDAKQVDFAIAFVLKQSDLDRAAKSVASRMKGDGLFWIAYPKKSSKRYSCEFDRDHGWGILGDLGFECVRNVAIDEDWSTLRFRRVEFIKTLNRAEHGALTDAGKTRTTDRGRKK